MEFTNLHARPMCFSQCMAYIVTNQAMILNLNICIYFTFWILTIQKKIQKVAKSWPKYIFFYYLCSLLLIYLIIAVSGLHFSTESTLFRRSIMKTKKLHSDSVRKN